MEKLSFTVIWDRLDLARQILVEARGIGLERSDGSFDDSMMNALLYDRDGFVELFLANGINVNSFLTISRLEKLYNTKIDRTLLWMLRDAVPPGKACKLSHIGRVIERLMGSGYRSEYCRRQFRKQYRTISEGLVRDFRKVQGHFTAPFHDMFIWAILTNRKRLATCFWKNGQEQLAKALVASKLYQSLANEANEDYLKMDLCREYTDNANHYKTLACELLDHYYQTDRDSTLQLLTYELRRFSRSTCIDLAVASRNRPFVAHQSCQLLLTNLWLGALRLRRNVNLKVLVAVLFPPIISALTFKTQEELQSQAQTVERFTTFQRSKKHQTRGTDSVNGEDSSDSSREDTDAESDQPNSEGSQSESVVVNRNDAGVNQYSGNDAGTIPTDDMVSPVSFLSDDNFRTGWTESSLDDVFLPRTSNCSRESMDTTNSHHFDEQSAFAALKKNQGAANMDPAALPKMPPVARRKTSHQLSLCQSIAEFYSAPIAAFCSFTIGYFMFLSFFTYIVLVRTPETPEWPEYYVTAVVITLFTDQIRKILMQKSRRLQAKLGLFMSSIWDVTTLIACLTFCLGCILRLYPETILAGRMVYNVNITFWYLRVLRLVSVNCKLSPYIHMYGKMVAQLFILSWILFVVLASFGILRQSIIHQHEDWTWTLLRNITYKPYAMLYGQVYPEELTECEDPEKGCTPGHWLIPLFMTVYLLLAMMVFMNMLVAEFSHIFTQVNDRAQEIAKFEAYHQVMEYAQQPFLPPPLTIVSHIVMVVQYVYRRYVKKQKRYRFDRSLKLLLREDEEGKLHEFELDCVKEMMEKKMENNSFDKQLTSLTRRLNMMAAQVDRLHEHCELHRSALLKIRRLLSSSNGSNRRRRRSQSSLLIST